MMAEVATGADQWNALGNCRTGDPDRLFVTGAKQREARRICRGCPVLAECLAKALDDRIEFGVWGGMTERQRRSMLKTRPEVTNWRTLLTRAIEHRDQAAGTDTAPPTRTHVTAPESLATLAPSTSTLPTSSLPTSSPPPLTSMQRCANSSTPARADAARTRLGRTGRTVPSASRTNRHQSASEALLLSPPLTEPLTRRADNVNLRCGERS
jgi:WhiB family redox-sensing transcriptional regulator